MWSGFGNRIAAAEILDRYVECYIEDTLSIFRLAEDGPAAKGVKNACVGELRYAEKR